MTPIDISYLTVIGAIACLVVPAYQGLFNTDRHGFKRVTSLGWGMLVVSLYLWGVNILSSRVMSNEKAEADSIRKSDREMYQSEIRKLRDTLHTTKDTLVKIGLAIDKKTGRLLVMDSQLLKKEFTQVFNVKYFTESSLKSVPQVKSMSEEFTNSTSLNIKLSHIPIEGTETFFINSVFILKSNWNRTGRNVKFTFKGLTMNNSDVISANYSYYK